MLILASLLLLSKNQDSEGLTGNMFSRNAKTLKQVPGSPIVVIFVH